MPRSCPHKSSRRIRRCPECPRNRQREGIRSRDGNPAGGLRGRRPRKLFLHVENETVGNIHVPGIDEGAASRTQDNIRMRDGEGGGVDRAAAGDFQGPVLQGHGERESRLP